MVEHLALLTIQIRNELSLSILNSIPQGANHWPIAYEMTMFSWIFKKRNIEHTKQKKVANKAINQEKNLWLLIVHKGAQKSGTETISAGIWLIKKDILFFFLGQ